MANISKLFLTIGCTILVFWIPILLLPPQTNSQTPTPTSDTTLFCDDKEGIETALGCIYFTPEKFIPKLVQILLGIAGGTAFLLMLFGSFQVIISSGNPERAKAGQELITAAITGLLFIIFSLFLLELIGVKILQLPGLS